MEMFTVKTTILFNQEKGDPENYSEEKFVHPDFLKAVKFAQNWFKLNQSEFVQVMAEIVQSKENENHKVVYTITQE